MSVSQQEEDKIIKKPVNKKTLFIGIGAIVGIMTLMIVAVAAKKRGANKNKGTAEEQSIAKIGGKAAAESERAANDVQQSDFGQGMKFDSQGNLLGAPSTADGVPQNWTMDEVSKTNKGSNAGSAIESAGIQPEAYLPSAVATKYTPSGNQDPDQMRVSQEVQKQERESLRESSLVFCDAEGITGRQSAQGLQPKTERPGGNLVGYMPNDASGYQDPQVQRMLAQASAMQAAQGQAAPAPGNQAWGAISRPLVSRPGQLSDMRIGGGPEIVVREGKWIDGVTVNRIETSFHDNPVTVMVSRDLLDRSGKYVLIPQGAKVLGLASRVQNQQQTRMFITFHRILFPDGRSAYFPERQMPEGFNLAGVLGADGKVNQHWFKKFGAAIVLGVVEGLAAAQAGNVRIDPMGGQTMSGSQYAVQAVGKQFNEVTKRMMDHYSNLAPTITLKAGTPMKIYFAEDVLLNAYMAVGGAHWVKTPGRR